MGVLNSWQRIDRVLPGFPFGSGSDGAYSSATIPTLNIKSCSGTSSSTTLTADTDASPYSVGDIVGIYQSRGTGAGQWEINRISSVGTDQYTLQTALHYTYTDSGASQAQVVKVPQYTTVTVESGTWTPTGWDGDKGGILPLAIKESLTITGNITNKGTNGGTSSGGSGTSDGGGYRGGKSIANSSNTYAGQGEGTTADRNGASYNANTNGGGAAYSGDGRASGGGAAHKNSGGDGTDEGSLTHKGLGGTSVGTPDLTTIFFGGGGGGASSQYADSPGQGGNGGGIVILFVKNITSISGSINVNGGDGGNGQVDGGAGAGGSVLVVCQTANLGSNLCTSLSGSNSSGGSGSEGRIAVHHSGTVTGTTSPTFTDVTDGTLVETSAGLLMNFI